MAVYSCRNCSNLKTRVITKGSLKSLKREKIRKALDIRDTESLGLDFPFNLTDRSDKIRAWAQNSQRCSLLLCTKEMMSKSIVISLQGDVLSEEWVSN